MDLTNLGDGVWVDELPGLKYTFVVFEGGGSLYIANLLTQNGIHCTHDHIHFYKDKRTDCLFVTSSGNKDWGKAVANSGMTLFHPEANSHKAVRHCKLIQVVRDPLKVIRSKYWMAFRDRTKDCHLILSRIMGWMCHVHACVQLSFRLREELPVIVQVENCLPFLEKLFCVQLVDIRHDLHHHGPREQDGDIRSRIEWEWDQLIILEHGIEYLRMAYSLGYVSEDLYLKHSRNPDKQWKSTIGGNLDE